MAYSTPANPHLQARQAQVSQETELRNLHSAGDPSLRMLVAWLQQEVGRRKDRLVNEVNDFPRAQGEIKGMIHILDTLTGARKLNQVP